MKKSREKKHRICAAFLCVCMLLSLPGISDIFPVVAAAERVESFQKENIITAFDPLSEDVKIQTVFTGTDRDELNLPEELTAYLLQESSEQKVEESEQENIGETDDIEKNSDTETRDEQPEDDGESAEKIDETGTEDEEGGTGESVPVEEQGKSETEQENTPSEEQQESVPTQETHTVIMPEYLAENVIPVQTLENTQTEKQEETVTIDGVTWQSEPEYDENTEGTYIFTAVLPNGYVLADGVSLPQIMVTVENGIDAIIQTLRDRIAALPEVEDYLASELDMEDEDAYAEWEEKLYVYAKEALDIWEEYEALTEEQQVQIPEEELAKLTAWLEIAETLSDNNAVMLVGYSEHHEESNWTALTTNDITLTNGKYYLSGDIEMGTITINGGDVTLCLNGHKLQHNGTDGSVIVVGSGTFTLCDCQDHWGYTSSFDEDTKTYSCGVTGTGGYITGGNGNNFLGGGVYVSANATFNMNSGRITNCDVGTTGALYRGGGVYVSGGIFNMSGGVIDGNIAKSGGGVYLAENAQFTMSGNAVIINNEGTENGGVATLANGHVVFNMDSGAIIGNKASGNGAGIFLGTTSTFIMKGGTIEGNSTTSTNDKASAGGIYCVASTISLSGDCLIRYNTANAGSGGIRVLTTSTISVSGNVYIQNNFGNGNKSENNVSLGENRTILVTGELRNDIGVTYKLMNNNPVSYPVKVVTGTGSHPISDADWSHFSSDNENYEIQKKETTDTGNELYLAEPGKCNLLNLTTDGATLSPSFDPNTTEYTSTVANSVNQVGITATLADASNATIKIKTNDGTTDMISGKEETVGLNVGENTIVITVTSGEMSKAYTIKITREEAPAGFTVTLHGNGGSAGTDLTSYDYGTGATLPTDWTRTGYSFAGWYENENCTGAKVENISATATGDKEYWAKWTPNSYTVTLHGNGGSAGTALTTYTYGTKVTLPTDWTRTGYTFSGWYDNENCTGTEVKEILATATGDKKYWAKWTPNSYTVTLNGNGGSAGTALTSYTYGTKVTLPTDWTKTGYTFAGWYENENCTGAKVENISATATGDKEYWAGWTPISYTISYNLDGGTVTGNPTSYTIESSAITLINPTKTGYSFGGWSGTDLTGSNNMSVTIAAGSTGDREYTAHWTAADYTVTLNGNGGQGGTSLTSYAHGTGATLPTDWRRAGYSFAGWYDNENCTGTEVMEIPATATGNKEYWAKWTPISYTITYVLDGGNVSGNPTVYTIESNAITLNNPTKEGYTFTGWSGTDLTDSNNKSVTIASGSIGDRTYTANWELKGYTVTLHTNGGTGGTDLTSYQFGTGAVLPTDWRKTGYTFAGWYNNENCTGDPVTEISAIETGNKTFWAKWTPQTYQVTFNNHGADGGDTETSKNVTYDGVYGTLPVPTRTGYTFQGWYTEADGKGTEVNAGTTVTTASAHTLHAYWKDETAPDQPILQNGVTLPADTDWTNTQTTIPLKLYDGVGVTSLLVSVDGNADYIEVSGFSGGTGSMTYDYTPVLEGKHTYQFIAKDAAGNISVASDIFTVRLDQTKPVIGTLTYDNAVHTNLWHWIIGKKSMVVHVPVTDAGSGVTEISYTMTPRDAAGNLASSSAETKTATVTNGEAKITFDNDFRGTITINCTDKAGNAADSMTIGADAGGVIVEDNAPDITILADRNISDTQQTQPSGVAVSEGYYNSAPALFVTVKDDTGNAITAGLASVTYQVDGGEEKSVTVDTSVLQEEVTFTIPATEIAAGSTQIKVIIKATDNAGNTADRDITINVKGPEKQPAAVIDYRQEELTGLVPGGSYTIDGTAYTADGEGHIAIKENWLGGSISIVKKGNGSETSDSTAQSLSVPARPAAPGTPELSTRDDKSITLKTILNAQYRLADGTDNWQDSTAFTGLAQKTIYRFRAYYPATDTSFASRESGEAQIATMPTAPTPDKLRIGYAAETLTFTDGIEAFTDQSCTASVTAGSVTAYMGQTVYIRYPADGIIPASLTTAVSIPERPAKPTSGKEDASYPKATDGAITGLMPGTTYEYRVKDTDGNFGAWKAATPSGTKIENLPAGDYEVRVKAVETGNASFQSEAAAVTIGATPATKYETPKTRIDYPAETLTGFVPGAKYTIGSDTITAGADGTMPIKKEWFGTTLSITRNGNDKDKLDSDPQSLPVPARPAKPTPTGVDVSTAGGTGKLTGLTAGTAYEVSTDGGKTWASHTADGSGQITGLLPGTYVVRVKAGTDHFASEPSGSVKIGAYQIKVTFMVDGQKYREIPVDYGAALTDIPPVPTKDNAIGAWCMDEQGTTPATFTNITADMTVYAVYTTAYTVTLQTGTGYTLSAQGDSESPVKEGGSFTFRFALADGYQRNADFAVKVNGVEVELTAQEPYTYTIMDIREDKTVTVEGVGKKPDGKPSSPGGGGDKEDDKPETTPPPSESSDDTPSTPPVKPPVKVTPPAPAPGETPPAEKQPEGRPGTTPKQEESGEQEPESTGTKKPEKDSADAGQTEKEPQAEKKEIKIGNGTVIVTVVCEEEKCTATVADTEKVVKAVLTPDQQELVNGGETIEIRIDVTDISEKVPAQDKEVIESGIEAYREEVPGLVLGMYVDISMFIKIGAGDWNAITETDEPIEVVVNIPEKLLSDGREFYIIRAHNGEYTFMNDLDDAPDTITVSTDLFSSYAIAYVETEGAGADSGAKCGLCHICPTFLGICYFVWLAIIIVLALVIYLIIRCKRKEEENEEQ